mgnify:CR=1 FL=1
MKITWLGHASFLIETATASIVTDPFDESTGYRVPNVSADLVTVSHQHYDHNAVGTVRGNPRVVSEPGVTRFGEIEIKGIKTFHDKNLGRDRGENLVFVIKADGLTVCHLGDLGHVLTPDQLQAIGQVDFLLVPVGGTYTISAEEARTIVSLLAPRVAIPMHFKTPPCTIRLTPVESFTMHYDRVAKLPYLDLAERDLNLLPEVVVLDYSYI